ncbi:MAG: peptidoglycan DD-metalloendopeptidase family protein [Woeseiaceae bacterium]
MDRPVSPLLHDYKPSAARKPAKSKAVQWFAVGLGIPLVGVALLSALGTDDEPLPPVVEEPVMIASDADIVPVEQMDADAITGDVLETAPPPSEYDRLNLTIGRGDTMEKLFRQHGLNIGELMTIAQLEEAEKQFRRIKPGDVFEIEHDDGNIVSLYSKLDLTRGLRITTGEDGFTAEIIDPPVEIQKRFAYGVIEKRFAYGVIETSLFESAAQAGLSDTTIMNMAGIFAWDVDFILDIRAGDNYYVHYEEIWQDGEYVKDGEIIAAEFNNNGRQIRAIRFRDDNGRTDYFTPEGKSVRKAFIRAPVDFTRISSNFNPRRKHPILNTIRAHRGVDYAAPRGTPIKAAGDGKVIFRGNKGGYGRVVILQHGGNITTLYAHLSNFAAKARLGSRVRQGQTIGYVGKSGLATASHLHYEYRLNGVHRNPRTVSLPDAEPIAEQYRERFLAQAAPILEELEDFKRTRLAAVAYTSR